MEDDFASISNLKNIKSKSDRELLKKIFKKIKPIDKTIKAYKKIKNPTELLSKKYLIVDLRKPKHSKNSSICVINISPGIKVFSLNKKKLIIDKNCHNFLSYTNTIKDIVYHHIMVIPKDSSLLSNQKEIITDKYLVSDQKEIITDKYLVSDQKEIITDESLIEEIIEIVEYINRITNMIVSLQIGYK